MKAAQLRQSILQAAVQGKLIPQNIHDEPASELLVRIRKEKELLVKEDKIKKEKPLPPITEDDIPYDLPDGWVWCRLGDIAEVGTGSTPLKGHTDYYGGGIPWIMSAATNDDIIYKADVYITQKAVDENHLSINPIGTLVMAMYGQGKTRGQVSELALEATTNQACATINVNSTIRRKYIKIYLKYIYLEIRALAEGGAQPNLNLQKIKTYSVPLPPLAEQQRIVAKVDELMVLCNELEAAEKELDTLEVRFAEYLPKSILQAAVQGKLVPQNVHDEPASELLSRIRQEKERLVKEGKIKKEKPVPPIMEDDTPFDLPDGWVWCRLGETVLQNLGGGTPSKQKSEYWNGSIPWASVKDLSSDVLTQTKDSITDVGLAESSSNLIPSGAVIVCTRMGLGKIALNRIPVAINQDLRALFLSEFINKRYFINYYKAQEIIGDGMTVKGISIDELHSMLFPLPPLAEQLRIVAKVDELMVLCDELKTAKEITVKPGAAHILPFPQIGEGELEYNIGFAARGDGEDLPPEALADIAKLFGEDENA